MSEAPPNPYHSPTAATLVTAANFSCDGFSYSITMESFQKSKIKPNNYVLNYTQVQVKMKKSVKILRIFTRKDKYLKSEQSNYWQLLKKNNKFNI